MLERLYVAGGRRHTMVWRDLHVFVFLHPFIRRSDTLIVPTFNQSCSMDHRGGVVGRVHRDVVLTVRGSVSPVVQGSEIRKFREFSERSSCPAYCCTMYWSSAAYRNRTSFLKLFRPVATITTKNITQSTEIRIWI